MHTHDHGDDMYALNNDYDMYYIVCTHVCTKYVRFSASCRTQDVCALHAACMMYL